MATYRLIMDDQTYVRLVKIAGEKGVTVGKLINLILKGYVQNYFANKGGSNVAKQ